MVKKVSNIFLGIIIFVLIFESCAVNSKSNKYHFKNKGNPMDPMKRVHHIDCRKTDPKRMLLEQKEKVSKPKIKMLSPMDCPWDKTYVIKSKSNIRPKK